MFFSIFLLEIITERLTYPSDKNVHHNYGQSCDGQLASDCPSQKCDKNDGHFLSESSPQYTRVRSRDPVGSKKPF